MSLPFSKPLIISIILSLFFSSVYAQPFHPQKKAYDAILETQKIVQYLDQWEGKTAAGLPALIKTESLSAKEISNSSYEEALKWYTNLAGSGNAYAQCVLGYYYEHTEYSRSSIEKAFSWYKKASDASYIPGKYYLAQCAYTYKALLEQTEILSLTKTACDAGFPAAQYFYSLLQYYDYLNNNEDNKITVLLEQAADAGYEEAYMSLANMYRYAYDLEGSAEKADFYEQLAAENNDPEAYRSIAVDYQYGYSEKEANILMAFEYYKKAAELGDAYSMEDVARFYRGSYKGIPYDQAKSVWWFEQAALTMQKEKVKAELIASDSFTALFQKANEGSPTAMSELGYAYYYGEGTAVDEEEARFWFEKANSIQDDSGSESTLAYMYYSGAGGKKDLSKAVQWYKKAVQKDSYFLSVIQSIYNAVLGMENFYAEIKGQDYYQPVNSERILPLYVKDIQKEEAFAWYKEQAEKGDNVSRTITAFCLQHGLGVKKNETDAFNWFTKASEDDFLPARYALALLYENGTGIAKDTKRAYEIFLECAQNNYEKAYLKAASMYLLGEGVNRSLEDSNYYAEEADYYGVQSMVYTIDPESFDLVQQYNELYSKSLSGSADDIYNLAVFFENNYDTANAVALYLQGEKLNHLPSLVSIANAYEKGYGVKQDIDKSLNLYIKAADMNSEDALYYLGDRYWYGRNCQRDPVKASEYLEKAAALGNADAVSLLAKITGEEEAQEDYDSYGDGYDYYNDYYDDDYYDYYDGYYDDDYGDDYWYDDYYEDYETSISCFGKKISITNETSSQYTSFSNTPESAACFFFASFLRGDTEWIKVCDASDIEYFTETYRDFYSSSSGVTIVSYDIFPETLTDTGSNYYEMKIGITYTYGDEIFSGSDSIELYKNQGLWQVWSIPE